jgi:peptide chain release factor 1
VRSGEGGKDAKLFVHDLMAAYCKYALAKGLQGDILHTTEGHVVARFAGSNAGHLFRHEAGKHCLQRVPPTESKGRRHTSFVCVAVLPLPPDNAVRPLPEAEVEVTCQCGHGPGGQHQNKTASAVRAVHRPTGIVVFINGRDQHRNRREALRILTARVHEHHAGQRNAAYDDLRKRQLGDGGRGDKVRTYNCIGGGRVVDHRLGTRTHDVEGVLKKGQFDLLFQS